MSLLRLRTMLCVPRQKRLAAANSSSERLADWAVAPKSRTVSRRGGVVQAGMKSSRNSLSGCGSPMKHESDPPVSTEKRSPAVQIVLNPRAGRGHGLVLVEPLTSELKRRGYSPSVLVTEDPGHARRWAKECRQPPDYLISLAGDDTLFRSSRRLWASAMSAPKRSAT